jgi:hypothetical protein
MRRIEHNLNTNRSRESKSKYNRNKILGNNRKNLIRSVDSLSVCPFTISSPESSEYYEKIWDRRYNDNTVPPIWVCHPLSVPLVTREMRKAGNSVNDIEKVISILHTISTTVD